MASRLAQASLTALVLAAAAAFVAVAQNADHRRDMVGAPRAEQATIAPAKNLTVEGVPPVPASLVEKVKPYLRYAWAAPLFWHPSRLEMTVNYRAGGTMRLFDLQTPVPPDGAGGTPPQRLTEVKDFPRAQTLLYQPGVGKYFAYTRDADGDERSQIYVYERASGRERLITDGRSKNVDPRWSPSGRLMVYGSNRRDGKNMDLWVVDPDDPASSTRLVGRMDRGYTVALDWSPDERWIVAYNFLSTNRISLWQFDVATGARSQVSPDGGRGEVAYWTAKYSKDGRGLYVTTNIKSDFQQLAYLDLATKRLTFLLEGIDWDVDAVELSPDGRTLALTVNEAGQGRLRLIDTTSKKEKRAPALPIGIIDDLKWHGDSNHLAFTIESVRSQGDVYSLATGTLEVKRWTKIEQKTDAGDSTVELIEWKSFDGLTVSGFLYKPPADEFPGKRPVIIDVHGGPTDQARPGFLRENNYILRELGVAFIYPNVRGSYGYGKRFVALDDGLKREDGIKDIGALLDWVGGRDDLDAGRVMVAGQSYGGYVALSVAARYAGRVRAAASFSGVSDLVTHLEKMEPAVRERQRAEYGDERDKMVRAYLTGISPLRNARRIRGPLLIAHGANDPRVPLGEAEQIVAAVKRNDLPVWLIKAADEGHGFAKQGNIAYRFYATVMFVKEYLIADSPATTIRAGG